MPSAIFLLLCLGLGLIGWLTARARAWALRQHSGTRRLHSLPAFHGWYVALWTVAPSLAFGALWSALSPALVTRAVLSDRAAAFLPAQDFARQSILAEARAVATGAAQTVFTPEAQGLVAPFRAAIAHYQALGLGITLIIALVGGASAFLRLRPDLAARNRVERAIMLVLLLASLAAILATAGIVASLVTETLRFFALVPPSAFFFGTHWAPDPMASGPADAGEFGALPLFWGSFFIGAGIAMAVAVPLGLLNAIALTQYAGPRLRSVMKPLLELLAGVPTVVYGYFAALTVAPRVRDLGLALGVTDASTESAMAAGLVIGVMLIPLVSSMADDALRAVPRALRDGSLALGATLAETIGRVLIPAALPGIVAGVMLAVSRAIGETMIVVMAAGASVQWTANPFHSMATVTYQIVALLTGEGTFDHPATLAAFALGMVLFAVTLALNFVALRVVQRTRMAHE